MDEQTLQANGYVNITLLKSQVDNLTIKISEPGLQQQWEWQRSYLNWAINIAK